MGRRRCAEPFCRHAPRAHTDGPCRLCSCTRWLDKKRHVWREQVADAWLLATETWLLHREAVAIGYATEEREFEEHHPRPRLGDFMDAMRPGVPPEVLEELRTPCRCCEKARQLLPDPSG
jgi:hypothetical protein